MSTETPDARWAAWWTNFEKAEDKMLELMKLAAAADQPLVTLMKTLGIRKDAQVFTIEDGKLPDFVVPEGYEQALVIGVNHEVGYAVRADNVFQAEDVEIVVELPLTKDDLPNVDRLLVEAMAKAEQVLAQALVSRVTDKAGTAGQLLVGVRREPSVLAAVDDTRQQYKLIAFELINIVLPYKAQVQ